MKNDIKRLAKLAAVAALALAMTAALAACTSTTELAPIGSPSPSPSALEPLPSASPSALPGTSPLASPGSQPLATDQPAAPTLSNQESAALAGQCDARISQISEVESSVTVVLGDTSLTGVKFVPAYKGALTSRISDVISGSVRAVSPSVATVKITDDPDIADRISALRDKQKDGGSSSEIRGEFDSINSAIK
ncbi:MAG: YhcN/YlaJ family sporulation lipoprotein [Oscillospiraceae bacterium]|nr:YhcN/YlaJ family sporulation lipoprotein [Oscillospiraceae bacterium]